MCQRGTLHRTACVDDAVTHVVVTSFLHRNDGRFDEFYHDVAIGVVPRTLALAWLLVGVFRIGLRKAPALRPARGASAVTESDAS